MAKKLSRTKSQRIAYWVVLISFAAPLIYYLVEMVLGVFDTVNLLTMLQCALGPIVLHVPDFLSEKLRFEIPSLLYVFYLVFLYCAIFLGEFYDMFNRVPFWDVILHCSSSLVSGFLGFMFVAILNKSEKVMFRLSPVFVSLFAFCFAVTIGALWEIYEYVFDGLLGLNMQKFTTPDGTVLVGHAALVDTMEDIIIDAVGGFAASVIGYISLKHKRNGWFQSFWKQKHKRRRSCLVARGKLFLPRINIQKMAALLCRMSRNFLFAQEKTDPLKAKIVPSAWPFSVKGRDFFVSIISPHFSEAPRGKRKRCFPRWFLQCFLVHRLSKMPDAK